MTRIGLVLGAGGTVGQAYHAGVLAALEHDLGWDARTADVMVGTSAGSVTATLLRLGVPASELAAWAARAPLSVESRDLQQLLGADPPQFPPFTINHWLRPWRLPSPALVARLARRPWAFRPSVAAMTLLPSGRVDLIQHANGLGEAAADAWPDGLWICAARRSDGRRVVFGRDGSPRASLPQAVAASCAIPGYFSSVEVAGVEYFDGGVHSPSNADILRRAGLDLVIAVSPMSAAGGLARTTDGLFRYSVHRRLERELARLARDGTTVVRIEPAVETLAAMGVNMMAADRSDKVVQAAFVETGAYVAKAPVITRLAPIDRRLTRHRLDS
ncbi:MAG: patatin-like phospholipase family protein [Nitriliruptorales bacterium]|nr:patatin-like phospholipase family protein [Nitriliruptorales bacterium]